MLAIAAAGIAATQLGLVPARLAPASAEASGDAHDFGDLESLLPAGVLGRAAEDRASFDGIEAATDDSMLGGVLSALQQQLQPSAGPNDLNRVAAAVEYIPGSGDNDDTAVIAYRVSGWTAADWTRPLQSLVADQVVDQAWSFAPATLSGRQVLHGTGDATIGSDWIYQSNDVVFEVMSPEDDVAAAVIAALR